MDFLFINLVVCVLLLLDLYIKFIFFVNSIFIINNYIFYFVFVFFDETIFASILLNCCCCFNSRSLVQPIHQDTFSI